MWRGVIEGKPYLTGHSMLMAGYLRPPDGRLSDLTAGGAQGQALINWVAEVKNAHDQPMPMQDWVHTARHEDALAPFATFGFAFLDVPALIRGATAIYQYPMVDRDPLPTWDFGRVTLLGDAAHPMYPVGCERCLAGDPRRPGSGPGAGVTTVDRGGGGGLRRRASPGQTAGCRAGQPPGGARELPYGIVEERAPDGFAHIDDVVSQEELEEISRTAYKRTAGFDPETLNNRPSLAVRTASAARSPRRGEMDGPKETRKESSNVRSRFPTT